MKNSGRTTNEPIYIIYINTGYYMITRDITVKNSVGLHARPATFFIQRANSFKCSLYVEREDRRMNAKSLLGVLSLGIVKGTEITLIADGPDEEAAINDLVNLIENELED